MHTLFNVKSEWDWSPTTLYPGQSKCVYRIVELYRSKMHAPLSVANVTTAMELWEGVMPECSLSRQDGVVGTMLMNNVVNFMFPHSADPEVIKVTRFSGANAVP